MSLRLLCIVFFPALVSGTPVPELPENGRIVGGVPADIKDYPYQVSLEIDGVHSCGGAIVGESFILSSGFCTYGWECCNETIRANTTRVVGVGEGTIHLVTNIYVHPDYVELDYDRDYDISIIELEKPLTFGDGVQPIGLPDSGQELTNRSLLTISGWGFTSENDWTPYKCLLAVNVTSYANEECKTSYDSIDLPVTDRMICGNTPGGGHNSCDQDTGGPVTHDGVLYGVVSWAKGCAEAEYPTVYTKLANPSIRDFVRSITGI